MNRIFSFLILSCMLIFSGCEKEGISRIGFETTFNAGSSGTTTMKVSDDSGKLYLKGTLNLTEGQLTLEVLDPDGMNAYSNSFMLPGEITIDEFYYAKKGKWTMNYSSYGGSGSIDVHLSDQP